MFLGKIYAFHICVLFEMHFFLCRLVMQFAYKELMTGKYKSTPKRIQRKMNWKNNHGLERALTRSYTKPQVARLKRFFYCCHHFVATFYLNSFFSYVCYFRHTIFSLVRVELWMYLCKKRKKALVQRYYTYNEMLKLLRYIETLYCSHCK